LRIALIHPLAWFASAKSLDETNLSNGEVYTILTNKGAHGGKGALAAMVRGMTSDTVSEILKKVPCELRGRVKTVTTYLSSAMMLTVRTVFPKAMLFNDRFHVQQLVTDTIVQMRIGFCWQVVVEENKAFGGKRRAKRKAAHTRAEKDLIGEWEALRMEDGETKRRLPWLAHVSVLGLCRACWPRIVFILCMRRACPWLEPPGR